MRSKRLAIFLVLAAGGVLVGLLATGVLKGNQQNISTAVVTDTPPTETTGTQPVAGSTFSENDWGTYGGTFDQNRHSPLTQITKQNINELGRVATIDFRRLNPLVPRGSRASRSS